MAATLFIIFGGKSFVQIKKLYLKEALETILVKTYYALHETKCDNQLYYVCFKIFLLDNHFIIPNILCTYNECLSFRNK